MALPARRPLPQIVLEAGGNTHAADAGQFIVQVTRNQSRTVSNIDIGTGVAESYVQQRNRSTSELTVTGETGWAFRWRIRFQCRTIALDDAVHIALTGASHRTRGDLTKGVT